MAADIRRERHLVLSVESHLIEVGEVGILAGLLAIRPEPHRARRLVDLRAGRHRSGAIGDAILELAGLEVVEEKLGKVLALRVQDDLFRWPEDLPLNADLDLGFLAL